MKQYHVKISSTAVLKDINSKELETELLFGEIFIGEEEIEGWVHGYCEHDEYKGWVRRDTLSRNAFTPTHIINVAHTISYKNNEIESEVVNHLSFGSKIEVVKTDEGRYGELMAQLSTGEWVMSAHITDINSFEKDYVTTALKFLNTPYRWGGRSGLGIDCSGLTQVCFARAGIKIPRNVSQQIEFFKNDVAPEEIQKGDIVFFKGHVGIMIDDKNIITAIGDRPRGGIGGRVGMIVRTEPLEEITKLYEGIKAIKRP